jgi:hypothetical protein
MALKLVGAGLGRTGTLSLKQALERLLGEPCYHMLEVFSRPDHVADWQAAIDGTLPDWNAMFDGFAAVVDWPSAAFWREIAEANPDAPVLLSTRATPEEWWRSADRTILEVFRAEPPEERNAWHAMVTDLFRNRFVHDFLDPETAKAAYARHNEDVRKAIGPGRLVEWQPGDGWAPLCEALGLDIPNEPFPHTNTTEEFRSRAGWD